MSRYIERRRLTYYAVVEVPPSLREKVGKKRLIRSLETRDLAVARDRRWQVVAELKREIEDARKGPSEAHGAHPTPRQRREPLTEDRRRLIQEGLDWREALAKGSETGDPDDPTSYAFDDRVDAVRDELGHEAAGVLTVVATGQGTPLKTYLDAWVMERRFKARTAGDRLRALDRLEAWGVSTIEEVTRKRAGQYVSYMMTHRDKTWTGDHATLVKYISALSSYWQFLINKGHVEINPWQNQTPPRPRASALDHDLDTDERAFSEEEMIKLLKGTTVPLLRDAMRIGALSGARLDAIISLKVKDCQGGFLRFKPQKGEKKARLVPLHPDLVALVQQRVSGKDDTSFIFDEVETPPPGSQRERSMPVSKRFGRYLRALGLEVIVPGKRRSLTNFHSFRRWFATQAERAGQSGDTIASVLGHKRGTITLDDYSDGPGAVLMRACVEAVRLPAHTTEATSSE
ncbi:DUF6538 domain-containing protein [Alsobacter sp. KACC 23698]|uniref:DUF6538 domain-containing protein n=1 Tax=Alsobacter sp. KACC 23698 TaxID=3149229 RepID=A0AAU7J9X0_9HYPH